MPDNGDVADDEINVIPTSTTSAFYGWPLTAGNLPPVDGAIAPVYVFPKVVAKLRGMSPVWDEFQRGLIDSVLQPRPVSSLPSTLPTRR